MTLGFTFILIDHAPFLLRRLFACRRVKGRIICTFSVIRHTISQLEYTIIYQALNQIMHDTPGQQDTCTCEDIEKHPPIATEIAIAPYLRHNTQIKQKNSHAATKMQTQKMNEINPPPT